MTTSALPLERERPDYSDESITFTQQPIQLRRMAGRATSSTQRTGTRPRLTYQPVTTAGLSSGIGRERRTESLSRSRHASIPSRSGGKGDTQTQTSLSFKRALFVGSSIVSMLFLLLYTVTFLLVAGGITLSNAFAYGQMHTTVTTAPLNGQASTILTSNTNGTIYVTIISLKNGSAKTYTGPTLNSDAWGGDTSSVVATASVAQGKSSTITIDLIGGVSYFHPFFTRPHMKFLLVPDDAKTGYTIVLP